jgi:hypothetical protein
MPGAFAKPDNVLTLAGIALADVAVLVSAQQYVPTLHLAKTSFWSGTKIDRIRFGSYRAAGLIDIAKAEASARAGTWDAWAFACVANADQKLAFRVEAGDAPLATSVRIIQEFRPPKDGFGLLGTPRMALLASDKFLPPDEAELSRWQSFLHQGISKLKTARDNWEAWSASPPGPVGA